MSSADLNTITLPAEEYDKQLYISAERPAYADFNDPETVEGGVNKPGGGLWTSTWKGRPQLSAWVEWSAGEQFYTGDEKAWLLSPTHGTELVVIDSDDDYAALVEAYPGETKVGGFRPDWEEVAYDYDGIWLTEKGVSDTRYLVRDYMDSLYGWDVESTVWLDWRVDGIEPVGDIDWEDHPDYREFYG